MTKRECEMLIYEKMKEIINVYKRYDADADYLTLAWFDDGSDYVHFWGTKRGTEGYSVDFNSINEGDEYDT